MPFATSTAPGYLERVAAVLLRLFGTHALVAPHAPLSIADAPAAPARPGRAPRAAAQPRHA